jgi:hypothetical protein
MATVSRVMLGLTNSTSVMDRQVHIMHINDPGSVRHTNHNTYSCYKFPHETAQIIPKNEQIYLQIQRTLQRLAPESFITTTRTFTQVKRM